MIENKQYIIFDVNEKIDSLLLADLKAYGYKMKHLSSENKTDEERVSKSEEIFDCLNQLFHYKGHRKAQVVIVTDKEETVAAAKEMEIDSLGFVIEGGDFIARAEEDMRALLIDEAELQAIREGAKMPKDGPTSIYVRGKESKGDGENRTNAFTVVWKFLYPYLLFFFSKSLLWNACSMLTTFLAGTSDTLHNFVYGFMVNRIEETGELMATPNGEAMLQIPTLLLSGLIMYFFVGGKKALNTAKEEVKELSIKNVAICAGITLVMALGLNFCFAGFDFFKFDATYLEATKRMYDVVWPVGLILYVVVAPFVEELVFRGIIFNNVRGMVKPLFAAALSAALFAYGHAGVLQMVYAFIIGFMFAYAYHHTRKFWVPVVMHSAINLVVYILGSMELFKENTTLAIVGLVCAVLSVGTIYFKKERP